MPNENRQKIKLLKLVEMLRQADEENPLTTNQLIENLSLMGISCDRRSLTRDMDLLAEFGYDISERYVQHRKAYYIEQDQFSIPELKILIDAVQASRFITEKKSEELIDKIAALGGAQKSRILRENMVHFNTRKHSNEEIYYNISELENAVREGKQVSFFYFDLNEQGQRVFRRNKKRYIVHPIALVFSEDNYYLSCFSSRYDGITNYRIDRMAQVNTEAEPVSPEALLAREQLAVFREQAFQMFGGPPEEVVLEFDEKIIGAVQDRFGEAAEITRLKKPGFRNTDSSGLSSRCSARVRVQISPTFWGWLFQFVGEMKITAPESAVQEYQDRLLTAIGDLGGRVGA